MVAELSPRVVFATVFLRAADGILVVWLEASVAVESRAVSAAAGHRAVAAVFDLQADAAVVESEVSAAVESRAPSPAVGPRAVVAIEPALEVFASVAEPEVFARAVAAAEPVLEVVASVAELEVAFVFVADVAEHRASVDIAVGVAASVPVSVFEVEIDSSGRPKFLSFPNVDHFANPSNSVEVVG